MDPFPIWVQTLQAHKIRLRVINEWKNFGLGVMWCLLSPVFIVFIAIGNVGRLMIAHDLSSSLVNIINDTTLGGVERMVHNLTATELIKWAASANLSQSLLDNLLFMGVSPKL